MMSIMMSIIMMMMMMMMMLMLTRKKEQQQQQQQQHRNRQNGNKPYRFDTSTKIWMELPYLNIIIPKMVVTDFICPNMIECSKVFKYTQTLSFYIVTVFWFIVLVKNINIVFVIQRPKQINLCLFHAFFFGILVHSNLRNDMPNMSVCTLDSFWQTKPFQLYWNYLYI